MIAISINRGQLGGDRGCSLKATDGGLDIGQEAFRLGSADFEIRIPQFEII